MGTQKPLLVPWLIEQLNNERYPGVSWLNLEKTLFRVPWKHASRQSINPRDFKIFEDWAIARHLYNPEKDLRTPSEWKRNFRSALNRKDGIEMVDDKSTDPEDPHKVYKISINTDNLNNPAVEDPLIPAENRSQGMSSLFSQEETQENVLSPLNRSSFDNEEDSPMWCQTLSKLDLDSSTTPMTPLEPTEGANEFGMAAENIIGYGNPPSSNLELYSPIAMNSPLEQLITTPFDLIGYMEGRNGCPNYNWWLCFGEEWPDSNCVWKKKLIMVQVIPKVLETLCELGKAHGASSLNDNEPDLRISDSLPHQLLEQLRKWEEKMDTV
uniref:IRF tryptophan pentad repeat domain-containing protein n=1 Tax=Micrurus corallinus TaxID=54390 RepID=A0A2D4G4W8_MICCO